MSIIHEALEKLEREKGESRLPAALPFPRPLRTLEKKEDVSGPGLSATYWISGALLFLFVVGLVYLAGNTSFVSRPPGESPSGGFFQTGLNPPDFVLTGMTWAGDENIAILNNQLVRTGEWVGGARVSQIDGDRVTLEVDGRTITLSLHGESIHYL